MSPFFADGIDIPIALGAGLGVLIPLLAFEVFVEALVLKKVWRLPYRELCGFTFTANCWSLIAGIPTKILNAFFLYGLLLPEEDIPGFFARYPLAVAIGSLIYFVVTVLVETLCAFRWRKAEQLSLSRNQVWRGMLLANAVTYAVLSPLYYYGTKPTADIREYKNDTHWTSHAATTILFIAPDGFLKSIHADGSGLQTIVPIRMVDYMISTNLNVCLFHGADRDLCLYRRDIGQTNLIWSTYEEYFMNQVAFSPSGERVAFASNKGHSVQMMEVSTGKQTNLPLDSNFKSSDELSVAWSPEESKLFIGDPQRDFSEMITIQPDGSTTLAFQGPNTPSLLKCYARTGRSWIMGENWGLTHSQDACGNLKAWTEEGLGSGLRISREVDSKYTTVLDMAVNPGLLHLSGFNFGDVEFLDGCNECLFESNGYIYLVDIKAKRLGTLVKGGHFIQLTPRDEKGL